MAMNILDKCRGKGNCFKKPAYRSTLRSQVLKPEKGLGELLTLPWYLPEPWCRHRLWQGHCPGVRITSSSALSPNIRLVNDDGEEMADPS